MKNELNPGNTFGEFVASCELDRMEQLDDELEAKEVYKAYEKRKREVHDILTKVIPDEYRKYLNEYNDINLTFRTMQRSFFYKHGFTDSMFLAEMMSRGRKDIKLSIKVV